MSLYTFSWLILMNVFYCHLLSFSISTWSVREKFISFCTGVPVFIGFFAPFENQEMLIIHLLDVVYTLYKISQ